MDPDSPGLFSVGLIDLCSTYSATGVTVQALRRIRDYGGATGDTLQDATRTIAGGSRPRRKWTRLTDEQRVAVISRYEDGTTSTALAADYGVTKSTIFGILRANNVVVRRQPLTSYQVHEAARLYETGLSLSQVAEHLKVNQETMRVAVIDAGVPMRPATRETAALEAGK
jgi:hypothetical protein